MSTINGQSKPSRVSITPPKSPLHGLVVLPGSKSITNRALLIAALARGTSRLSGALKSDDTSYMAQAIRKLGVVIEEPDDTTFLVSGTGRLLASPTPLFLGNAGTATRFLTAVAANIHGVTVIDGDSQMRKRPIAPLVDALLSMGVEICAPTGCPPVTIVGRGLVGGKIALNSSLSSQYLSALLIAGATGAEDFNISLTTPNIGARGYVEMTLAVMAAFGAHFEERGGVSWKIRPFGYRAADLEIEPDASTATYFWAAEALTGGSIDIGRRNSTFSQPDAAAHSYIYKFPHLPPAIDGSQMQDAIPTLAILAAFNKNSVRFTNISNLRVKECDRIAALAAELCRIRPGLAQEDGDDLVVYGDPELSCQYPTTNILTYADHRIAMAFALMGLRLPGLSILDPACTAKTFPQYWDVLSSLGIVLEFS